MKSCLVFLILCLSVEKSWQENQPSTITLESTRPAPQNQDGDSSVSNSGEESIIPAGLTAADHANLLDRCGEDPDTWSGFQLFYSTTKYPSPRITYKIENYTPDLKRCEVRNIFKKAFRVWEEVGEVTFVEAAENEWVDMKIKFVPEVHDCETEFGSPYQFIAHADQGGAIHFLETATWRIGNDPHHSIKTYGGNSDGADCVFPFDYFGREINECEVWSEINRMWCSTTANYTADRMWGKCSKNYDLFQVAVHEIGHTLGLQHTENCFSIMYPTYGYMEDFALHTVDIRGMQWIWHPRTSVLQLLQLETCGANKKILSPDEKKLMKRCSSKDRTSSYQLMKNTPHYTSITPHYTSIITYTISSYTSDLKRCEIRNIFKKAFRVWEEVGEVTFVEAAENEHVDLTIKFVDEDHSLDDENWPVGEMHFSNATTWTLENDDKRLSPYGADYCVFPFIFKGREYNSCTKDGSHDGRWWCAATSNYQRVNDPWGFCHLLPVLTRAGNADGAACVFPFIFNGREYNNCTKRGRSDGASWCGTTGNYDTDAKWGFCPPQYHLFPVAVRKIGRSLGFDDSDNCLSIMYNKYMSSIYGYVGNLPLHEVDILGMRHIYGRRTSTLSPLQLETCGQMEENSVVDEKKLMKRCSSKDRTSSYQLMKNIPHYTSVITYKIENYPQRKSTDLNRCEKRKIFKRAFRVWENAAEVTFVEANRNENVDLTIQFTEAKEDERKGYYQFNNGWRSEYSSDGIIKFNDIHMWWSENKPAVSRTTLGNSPCVFPFTFQGKEYNECTNDGRSDGIYWCSTTADYEADQQFDFCFLQYDLFVVAVREIGHAVGINDSLNCLSVMHESYGDLPDLSLNRVDVEAIQQIYGARTTPLRLLQLKDTCEEETTQQNVRETTREPITSTPIMESRNEDFSNVCNLNRYIGEANRHHYRLYFTNTTVTVVDKTGEQLLTTTIADYFESGPDHVDAVYWLSLKNHVTAVRLFQGQQYWEYINTEILDGFPKPLTNLGFPSHVQKVDAAINWKRSHKSTNTWTTFFVGEEFYSFNESKKRRRLIRGNPRQIEFWNLEFGVVTKSMDYPGNASMSVIFMKNRAMLMNNKNLKKNMPRLPGQIFNCT